MMDMSEKLTDEQLRERADGVIQKAAMALGSTDEWADQETMIADFEERFAALLEAKIPSFELFAAERELTAEVYRQKDIIVRDNVALRAERAKLEGALRRARALYLPLDLEREIDALLAQPAESGAIKQLTENEILGDPRDCVHVGPNGCYTTRSGAKP